LLLTQEVGSEEWMSQHRVLEKLNIQAHQCAMTNSDDFVTEAIVLHKQLDTIVNELIVIGTCSSAYAVISQFAQCNVLTVLCAECWKEFVYPKVVEVLAGKNSMRLYFVLYHEATLVRIISLKYAFVNDITPFRPTFWRWLCTTSMLWSPWMEKNGLK
jgi:hypothetical protein